MNLPKIEKLLTQGWDLTIRMHTPDRFHASVYLGNINGDESHHYMGPSVSVALERLEQYINEPESSAQRRGPSP
jgi:hypothetical protein